MPHLICYDITSDSLRGKMGKKILEYGLERINKSVYLGSITESSLIALEALLSGLVREKGEPQDSLIILPVTAQQVNDMRVYGENGLDKKELTGDKSTLIL